MAFTKKEIAADKALYQGVIDAIDSISLAAKSTSFDDLALVEKYQGLLCSGPTLKLCQKVERDYSGDCEAAGCPIFPCRDYVDRLWRCARALLFLAGKGGYKNEESMENRCRVCGNYETCRGVAGAMRAGCCIAHLKEGAERARTEVMEVLSKLE